MAAFYWIYYVVLCYSSVDPNLLPIRQHHICDFYYIYILEQICFILSPLRWNLKVLHYQLQKSPMDVQNNCHWPAGVFQIYIFRVVISLDSECKPVAYIDNKISTNN